MRKNIIRLLAMSLFFILFTAAPCHLVAKNQAPEVDTLEEILSSVVDLHVSKPGSGALIEGAIGGLLDSLKDPYTEYIPPEHLEDFSDSLEGDYAGVGIHMQPGNDYPKVIGVFDRTPAGIAGVKPGDLLIKVNGVNVTKEPLGKIVQKIRGPEGTKVCLTIRRAGAGDMDFELVRAKINSPTVSGTIFDGDTGYIYISTFGEETGGEFRKALEDLSRQGVAKLVLDLRDNPGGLVHAAVEICGNFIEPGQVVVSAVNRDSERKEFVAGGNPTGKGMRVAILVNQNSASSAEILAGALQDHGAAVLVGSRTYGKGTMQAVVGLSSGGVLKITTDRCRTPKGRVIDGAGLSPDIQVLTPELVQVAALRYLNQREKNTVIFQADKSGTTVNGSAVEKGRALLRGDTVYLPLRFVFEALGYRVDWRAGDRSIKIAGSGMDVVYYPGNGCVSLNGEVIPGLAAPVSENGETFIPASCLPLFPTKIKFEGDKIIVEN